MYLSSAFDNKEMKEGGEREEKGRGAAKECVEAE